MDYYLHTKMKIILLLCMICQQASSFTPLLSSKPAAKIVPSTEQSSLSFLNKKTVTGTLSAAVATFSLVPSALALDDFYSGSQDIEVADLPSPYVPVLFGFALLGGVALLTGSLGDVMTEESSLGLQSGAKAKKEMERSRSSYFKK
jgi:glycerol uptake facilitator-like aquaporin